MRQKQEVTEGLTSKDGLVDAQGCGTDSGESNVSGDFVTNWEKHRQKEEAHTGYTRKEDWTDNKAPQWLIQNIHGDTDIYSEDQQGGVMQFFPNPGFGHTTLLLFFFPTGVINQV